MDREIIRLKIEQETLKKETDAGFQGRLQTLEKEAVSKSRSADLTRAGVRRKQAFPRAEAQERTRQYRNELARSAAPWRISARRRTGLWPFRSAPEKRLAEYRSQRNSGEMNEEAVYQPHHRRQCKNTSADRRAGRQDAGRRKGSSCCRMEDPAPASALIKSQAEAVPMACPRRSS